MVGDVVHEIDVVVIGAGAAGLAAARRLSARQLSLVVLEARRRVGGRAWTVNASGLPLDLGCGWLHSADENEWSAIATQLGFEIDPTPPPWSRRAHEGAFSAEQQINFGRAWSAFYGRVEQAARLGSDRAAADLLEANDPWNGLLNALSSYVNGVELGRLSVIDFAQYHDTGTNWRVFKGYGALVKAFAEGLDVQLACPATLISHFGKQLRVTTPQGSITTRAVIIAVPPSIIASELLRFEPPLWDKLEAIHALPLGSAEKLFLRIDAPDGFPNETRVFGAIDRAATGSYHLRPFGRPVIEGYFGGEFARELHQEGEGAFGRFAIDQLAALWGNDIRKQLHPIAVSGWGCDRFARGSYSYAKVGHAGARARLAAGVDDRLFFAGEACSPHDFSTAHGAYRTGVQAAELVIRALGLTHEHPISRQ
jgi:monoamine oxidase